LYISQNFQTLLSDQCCSVTLHVRCPYVRTVYTKPEDELFMSFQNHHSKAHS